MKPHCVSLISVPPIMRVIKLRARREKEREEAKEVIKDDREVVKHAWFHHPHPHP